MAIRIKKSIARPASWGSRICNEGYNTGKKDAIMIIEKMIYEENKQREELYGQGYSGYNEEFSDGWLEGLRLAKKRLKRL